MFRVSVRFSVQVVSFLQETSQTLCSRTTTQTHKHLQYVTSMSLFISPSRFQRPQQLSRPQNFDRTPSSDTVKDCSPNPPPRPIGTDANPNGYQYAIGARTDPENMASLYCSVNVTDGRVAPRRRLVALIARAQLLRSFPRSNLKHYCTESATTCQYYRPRASNLTFVDTRHHSVNCDAEKTV